MSCVNEGIGITDCGAVGAFGLGKAAFAEAFGTAKNPCLPVSSSVPGWKLTPRVATAQIPALDLKAVLGRKGLRALNREAVLFSLAVQDVSKSLAGIEPEKLGITCGTQWAGLADYLMFWGDGMLWGPSRVSPIQGPNTGVNAPAAHLSLRTGAQAFNSTVSTGRVSALDAFQQAAAQLAEGRVQVVATGGVDIVGYQRLAWSSRQSGCPMPFDRDRTGAPPGEAAGVLVLGRIGDLRARGAPVLARLAGFASAFAPRQTDNELISALQHCIIQAFAHASLARTTVIVPSAAGDRRLDSIEARALAAAFGDHLSSAKVVPVCGVCGEAGGGGSALQLVAATQMLRSGEIWKAAGWKTADTALPPLNFCTETYRTDVESALVVGLDLAGHVSAIVLTQGKEKN